MIDSIPTDNTAPAPVKKRLRPPLGFDQQTQGIRRLIWLYLVLWLVEGGLRRWFLPGLATPLLLIRDPLVVAIYFMAFSKGLFPVNGFIISGVILAILELVNALAIGHGNPLVALYGMRCDFLHVPLMFVMARVLRRKDLLAVAKVAVWITIPYTALLVAQFYEPQSAWVNRGVGDSLEGAGFSGALDHFRPPGTFSFITGPTALYPLFTACWFVLVLARKLTAWLMVASGIAILVAIPVSISRSLFLAVALVAVGGLAALFVGGRFSGGAFFRVVVAAILLPLLALQLPACRDGMAAFGSRWESSTVEGGGVQVAIIDRMWEGLFGAFSGVGPLGLGTGYSTNVGQKMLTENVGFGASEGEWGRLLFDNGFLLGSLLVAYRIALAGVIVVASFRAWQRRSPYGLIFASAAFLMVLNGQWGQATSLGAAIIAGGLTLVASGENVKLGKSKAEKRKISASGWKSKAGKQGAAGKGSAAPFAVSAQSKITER
jgi:hypothetical protein